MISNKIVSPSIGSVEHEVLSILFNKNKTFERFAKYYDMKTAGILREIYDEKNKDISVEDAEKLIAKCRGNDVLMSACMSAPHLPEHFRRIVLSKKRASFYENLIDPQNTHISRHSITQLLPNNTIDGTPISQKALNKVFFENSINGICPPINQEVINWLAEPVIDKVISNAPLTDLELNLLEYTSSFVHNTKITSYLENCNDQIPEATLTAIANSPFISEIARNTAFDMGVNVSHLTRHTEYMANVLYEAIVPVITDPTDLMYDNDRDRWLLNIIPFYDMIEGGKFTSARLLDFLCRIEDMPVKFKSNDMPYSLALTKIAKSTTSTDVMNKLLQLGHIPCFFALFQSPHVPKDMKVKVVDKLLDMSLNGTNFMGKTSVLQQALKEGLLTEDHYKKIERAIPSHIDSRNLTAYAILLNHNTPANILLSIQEDHSCDILGAYIAVLREGFNTHLSNDEQRVSLSLLIDGTLPPANEIDLIKVDFDKIRDTWLNVLCRYDDYSQTSFIRNSLPRVLSFGKMKYHIAIESCFDDIKTDVSDLDFYLKIEKEKNQCAKILAKKKHDHAEHTKKEEIKDEQQK